LQRERHVKIFRSVCASAALLGLALGTPLVAKPNLSKGPLFVAEAERTVANGRAVPIELQTPEIGSAYAMGRVAEWSSSGSNGYYYWSSGTFSEAPALAQLAGREAEVRAAPLRKALQGFDGSTLVLNAVQNGIKEVSWFSPNPLEVLGKPRESSPLDFVYAAPTSQAAIISTSYYLSHDCGQIEVKAEIRIIKKIKKSVVMVAYQQVTSVVQLPNPSFDSNANVRRWSADNGAAARRAIAAGSARLEKLIPRALSLSQADITAYAAKDREMAQAAGRFGPVLERDLDGPRSVLIWSNGLISVQPLPAQ
jgi:hypothetical protein